MANRDEISIGIYEKAMPDNMAWTDKLELVKKTGYDFLEISIDESDFRLSRLTDFEEQKIIKDAIAKTGVPIYSMCLSGHRKYPLGSHDSKIRERSLEIMEQALELAVNIGVQRIQLAGYDVYYEASDESTLAYFDENLRKCVQLASKYGVILGFETMETPFMNTVAKAMHYVEKNQSPFLKVYPDLGNLYNGNKTHEALIQDIETGRGEYIAVHLKDTVPGIFRDLLFGEGDVDFEDGIKRFYDHGVRIFNCEIWDDKSGNHEKRMRDTINSVLSNL